VPCLLKRRARFQYRHRSARRFRRVPRRCRNPLLLRLSPRLRRVVPQSPAQPTPHAKRSEAARGTRPGEVLKCLCAFCGGHIEFPASASGDTTLCPHCNRSTRLSTTFVSPPPIAAAPCRQGCAASPLPKASFEMRLGTYWLVRIGIVLVLTSLVFCGTYAYQNYIGCSPGGKSFSALRRQRGPARVSAPGGSARRRSHP